LSGFYPGWVLSSFKPATAIKSKTGIRGGLRDNFRRGLVVFQFTVSLIFIITSFIIGNQLHFMLKKDLGFKQDAIITLTTNGKDSLGTKRAFAERLRTLSNVDQVSRNDLPPAIRGAHIISCTYDGTSPIEIGTNVRKADENYIPLYQIKMLAGRNFFPGDTLHAVINNFTCAKMLGFKHPEDAIGQYLRTLGSENPPVPGTFPVVGVVADFNIQPLDQKIGPLVILSSPADENAYSVKLKTLGSIDDIEKVWKDLFPHQPFVYHFYDDTIADFYRKEEKTSQIIYLGMAIAVFLSCIGLFALAALTAETRRKEIGIRKVLGATTTRLIYVIVKDFLRLVLLSFVLASPVAWLFANKWLQNYTYRISIGWWVFALACITAIFITMLTVGYHVIRVAIANPTKSLRVE
jgi:ABC-type antimicrobial peptide transport system permease subunit